MIIQNLVLASFLVFVSCQANSQKIDSLKDLLKNNRDLDRLDILYELSYNHIGIDNKIALQYGLEGHKLAKSFDDSLRIVRTGLVTTSALRRLQRIDSSLVIYDTILEIAEKNLCTSELAIILNSNCFHSGWLPAVCLSGEGSRIQGLNLPL